MNISPVDVLERAAKTIGDAWSRGDPARDLCLELIRGLIRQHAAPETLLFVREQPDDIRWTVGPISRPIPVVLDVDGAQMARDAIHAFNEGRKFEPLTTQQGFYTSVRRTLVKRLRDECPELAAEVAKIRMDGRYVPTPDSPQIITERFRRRPLTAT